MQKAIHGVFVPEEVTPFFLVEIPVTSSPLASRLRTLQREYLQKSPSVLLPEITTLRAAAVQLQADHLAAILRFFQADLLYRQEKLAAALTTVKSAQVEFSLQVPQLARYHEALVLYFTGLLYYLGRQPDAYPFLVAAVQSLEEVLTFWNYQGGHSSISHCQHLRLWINGLLTLQAEFYQTEECLIIPVYEYPPSDKVELVGATSVAPNEIRPSTEANALPRSQPGKTAILTLTEPPAWYYFALRIQPEASINHQHSLNELPAVAQQTATNFHRDASGKVTLVFPTGISYEITMGGAEEDER